MEYAIVLLRQIASGEKSSQHHASSPLASSSDPDQMNAASLSMWSEIRPKDAFTLGLLSLARGDVPAAVDSFRALEQHCIVEFCVSNPRLLLTDGTQPSVFAKLLREYFAWCLLECVVRLGSQISCSLALQLL